MARRGPIKGLEVSRRGCWRRTSPATAWAAGRSRRRSAARGSATG